MNNTRKEEKEKKNKEVKKAVEEIDKVKNFEYKPEKVLESSPEKIEK